MAKITLIYNNFLPNGMPGSSRHHLLFSDLSKNGHEVFVIASTFNHFSKNHIHNQKASVEIVTQEGIKICWIKTPPYKGNIGRVLNNYVFSIKLKYHKTIRTIIRSSDIVIGTSPDLISANSTRVLAKRFNKPFILEVRDIWPETICQLGNISKKHPFILWMKRVEKKLYNSATVIVSLLPYMKEYLDNKNLVYNQVQWLPNFSTMVPGFNPENKFSTVLVEEKQEPFRIIYTGSHGLSNNLKPLIKAAAKIEQRYLKRKILIELYGQGELKQELVNLTKKLKITCVVFHEPIEKQQILEKIQLADACIMLINESGLYQWGLSPNKLYDYMGMAKPVLFIGNSRYNPVEDEKAGLVINQSDSKLIADAIILLSNLPQKQLGQMGERGKAYVDKNASLAVISKKLESVIQLAMISETHVR